MANRADETNQEYQYESHIDVDNTRLCIHAATKFIDSPEHLAYTPHQHYFYEVHYIYEGEAEIILQDKKLLRLEKGHICVIPPNVFHGVHSKAPLHRFCFNLTVEYKPPKNSICQNQSSSLCNMFGLISRLDRIVTFRDPQISQLMEMYRDLVSNAYASHSVQLLLFSVLTRFFELYNEHFQRTVFSDQRTPAAAERKWQIENFISINYALSNGIPELSKILFLSERQTRNTVRSVMGENFKKLVTQQRMEVANILLEQEEYTLEDISLHVGYKTYNGFYLAFVKYYHVSPEVRRKELLRNPSKSAPVQSPKNDKGTQE